LEWQLHELHLPLYHHRPYMNHSRLFLFCSHCDVCESLGNLWGGKLQP
jgi:hypothetical protein